MIPTPHPMDCFRLIDAWLVERGWTEDRGAWRSEHGRKVTIATHEEACRIQRRRDAADYPVTVCAECLTASCWHGEFMCQRATTAGLVVRMASQLRVLAREHASNFSRAKILEVHGRFPAARTP